MLRYPPLEPFEYVERALGANNTFPDLLTPGTKVKDVTAALGAEVSGVQLNQLNDRGKDQLALLAAKKKLLIFRDQGFASLPIGQAVDFCRYFGRLFLHPHSGAPQGYPEIHLVHRRAGNTIAPDYFQSHTHSMAWHSDNTYEVQPPGITFLYSLEVPDAGGDTVFVDTEKAYQRLSPAFQERLRGLEAIHTARDQTARALANDGYVRREPIDTVHPIVRTHPATGKKALFVNPQFTRQVVGFKKEESDYLLKFLYDHMTSSHDLQCRVKWENGTVVVFDVSLFSDTRLSLRSVSKRFTSSEPKYYSLCPDRLDGWQTTTHCSVRHLHCHVYNKSNMLTVQWDSITPSAERPYDD